MKAIKQFKKKTAIVIGGTSGIGLASAKALLDKGVIVHIVGRNVDKVEENSNLIKHKIDITKSDNVQELIQVIEKLDTLDYLVNASGVFAPKPFLEHTLNDYNTYLDLERLITENEDLDLPKLRRVFIEAQLS